MDNFTATEQAYKNGYEQGMKDAVEVQKELQKVVTRLHNEYERAKKLSFVRNPLAYALYRVWKYVDGGDDKC